MLLRGITIVTTASALNLECDPQQQQEVQEEVQQDDYELEAEAEKRIAVLKEIILVREQKQLTKLHKTFVKENDVDCSMGECCCSWPNEQGAAYILRFDQIFFINVPRFILANWARINETRF